MKNSINKSSESLHQKRTDFFSPNVFEIICNSFIDKERKSLENVKRRKKGEIKATLEKEVKMEYMINHQNEKEKKKFEKVEMVRYNKMVEDRKKDRYNKKIHEYSQKVEDYYRKENEELLYLSEQRNNNNDVTEREYMHKSSKSTKNKNEQHKNNLLQSHINNYFERRIMKVEARRILQDQKEKVRKDKLEKERLEKLILSERQKILIERRLCKTKTAKDLNFCKIQHQILAKQKNNEKKLVNCLSFQEMAIRKKKVQEAVKLNNKVKVLQKANEEEEKRHQILNEKLEKIEQLVSFREASKRSIIKKRSQILRNLIIKALDARAELERENEIRNMGKSIKLENMQKRYEEGIKVKEKENLYKKENLSVFRFEQTQKIQRLNRVKNFKSEEQGNTIVKKRNKIDEYKQQQIKILKNKKNIMNSISKEKKELIDKFDEMMYKTKKINLKIIRQLFPKDKDLQSFVKEHQEQKNTDGNKSQKVFSNTGSFTSKSLFKFE